MQSALLIAGISTLIRSVSFKYTIGTGAARSLSGSVCLSYKPAGIAEQFDLTASVWYCPGGCPGYYTWEYLLGAQIPVSAYGDKGTVVFVIGITLYPAINIWRGSGGKDYGRRKNWTIALVTLAIVTILNHFGKGAVKFIFHITWNLAGYSMTHVSWND